MKPGRGNVHAIGSNAHWADDPLAILIRLHGVDVIRIHVYCLHLSGYDECSGLSTTRPSMDAVSI
jgi:hypothetical protein